MQIVWCILCFAYADLKNCSSYSYYLFILDKIILYYCNIFLKMYDMGYTNKKINKLRPHQSFFFGIFNLQSN